MRVSTNILYDQKMIGITLAQSKWMQQGAQLSSGQRVINPSDDPIAASQGVMVAQAESQNQQYMTARSFAKNAISMQLSVVSKSVGVVQNVSESLVATVNGILSDEDRNSLAIQLEGFKEQLVNLGNSTDGNGRYIFAGYKTDVKPFDENKSGVVSYNGGYEEMTQKVDSNRSMIIGHTGEQVFLSSTSNPEKEPDGSPSESDIFKTIDMAIRSLRTPLKGADQETRDDALELLNKANRGARNALNNISSVESVLGLQLKEIEELNSLGAERSLANKSRLSELVDVEWNSTISNYYQQQAALQASYKTFTDMKGMSLFEMYR
ncbi:flagellar hook-filament junction protein FlgL [Photorhabdus temperata]|uniref:Flagellar hook-associated protein 3 n=2 Tax=Photorhabdus khanii TaxID=1004150 RepID=W3V2K7_9GAMM|nr:flagellar hook-associated protein FlgL [Photorhabdus khanii]ETS30166.1 flagellar hook-associated protein 3 [Photorhabdus khanii NC19]MQL48711.1 flagellar hook-filament junction protein FlgL [Photorhabdus khanii]OHV55547.1 flagellar hook-filament junction protein FlgL [Photorhabdus temperata]